MKHTIKHTPMAIFIVLLAAALVLGYAIYTKSFKPSLPKTTTPSPATRVATPPQATGSASLKLPPWLASLSETERSIFNKVPGSNASAEEKQKFGELVQANAQSSSQLTIAKDCQPSPVVLAVDTSLSFKVKNTDTAAHTIRIGTTQYPVSPGATETVKLDKRGTRLSYGCDTYNRVGFLVTPL